MKISIRVSPQAQRVISGLKTDLAKKVRSISNDLFKSLKKFTPVRSGRARNAWKKKDGRFKLDKSANMKLEENRSSDGSKSTSKE